MLNNKNILITGIGKGIGKRLFLDATEAGGIVYGICKKKNDLADLSAFKSRIFIGDVTNKNFINKTFNFLKKKKLNCMD